MFKLKSSLLALCALVLFAAPLASRADSIQLISAPVSGSQGVAVYPYNVSVNNAVNTIMVACLNINREISIGEKWTVTATGLDGGTSGTLTQYRENAWLFSLFSNSAYKNNASDIQYAIWSIFTPSTTSSAGYTALSASLVNQAMTQATNSSLIASGFFNQFTLYAPTTDQTGWTNGTPQELLTQTSTLIPNTVAATPEPSTLVLLGTGLIGTAGTMLRRRRAAAAIA